MREMKDSGVEWIGEIPSNWEVKKLNNVANKITDYVASGSFADLNKNVQYLDEPDYAMLVRTADLSGTKDKKIYIDKSAYEFLANSNLFGGEVILSNIGSVGNVFYFKPLYERCSLAPNSIMVSDSPNNKYLYYWFVNPIANDELKRIGGNAVQLKFNKTQLRQFKVLCPPDDEQKRIVKFLDSKCAQIDSIISKQEAIIEKLKEYRISRISEMLDTIETRRLTLGKVINFIEQGWSPAPAERDEQGDWNVLTLAAIKYGCFYGYENKPFSNKKNKAEKSVLQQGDFLLTRANTRDLVGQVAIVDEVEKQTIFSDLIYRIKFNEQYVLPEYMLFYFQTAMMRQQISRDAHGSNETMVKITHKDICSWVFEMPSIEDQKRIVNIIKEKEALIAWELNIRNDIIQKLNEYKKSIIYELVTGKKEV